MEEINTNGDVDDAGVDEGDEEAAEDDQQWERVGPKNKSVVTRSVSFVTTCTIILEKEETQPFQNFTSANN